MTSHALAGVNRDVLTRVIFVLIGTIVGLLDFFLPRSVQPDALDSIYKAFGVTALLFIAELVLEIRNMRTDSGHPHAGFIARNRNLIGALLKRLDRELDQHIDTKDDAFSVHNATLPILSHDLFWQLLVERVSPARELTVLAVHSCSMQVWLNNPNLVAQQKDFVARGGTIRRVLCDSGSVAQNGSVLETSAAMAHERIDLTYYNLDTERVREHGFLWDFAVVEQTGEAAIWRSKATGGEILEAVYVSGDRYGGRQLTDLWRKIRRHSEQIPVNHATDASENTA